LEKLFLPNTIAFYTYYLYIEKQFVTEVIDMKQGGRFSHEQIMRIEKLLRTTELSIPEIARYIGCSAGPIGALNRRSGIRIYEGNRKTWRVGSETMFSGVPSLSK